MLIIPPEIWNVVGPLAELVLKGTPVYKEDGENVPPRVDVTCTNALLDLLLFKQLPHQGTGLYEVYFSWMWVPVRQEDGSVGGLWNATIDTTKRVLAERRLATVREMGERTCEKAVSVCQGTIDVQQSLVPCESSTPR